MTSLPCGLKIGRFWNYFLKANACVKPAIGTNVGGISDAIQDGFNGFLIKPNNPLELEKQ